MRHSTMIPYLLLAGVLVANAQQSPTTTSPNFPRADVAVGYNYIKTNAPPQGCDCFSLNGGFVSAGIHVNRWLSFAAEATEGRASNISALGQNLNLLTLATGPRVSMTRSRFTPFGQVLLGISHGSDSYFPNGTSFTTSATSYAAQVGAGLDVNLTSRFAIRAIDAEYLKTGFPNGTDNTQNHLMLGAGVVIKFGGRTVQTAEVIPTARPSEISFTCSTPSPEIPEGDVIEVVGHAFTEPDLLAVNYAWMTTGGSIASSGRRASINTSGMAGGDYRVTGTVSLASSPRTSTECTVAFRVIPRRMIAAAVPLTGVPTPDELAASDKVFHTNVRDALFDYDSSKIRPDAQLAIQSAARYLKQNAGIRVLLQGYADERGSSEYNLALGAERAKATRDALIAEGVDADRIELISFGKEAQVCTEESEVCWQQNRRAAFSLHR